VAFLARQVPRSGSRWVEHGLVSPSTISTPLEPRNALRHFHDRLAKAGLPRKHFHDLRHTTATLRLAQGVSPRVIMETFGHSQFSLTMDPYSHVLLDGQRDAAARMDDILRWLTGHDRTPETGRASQHDEPPPTPAA
jgi:integrase